MPHQNRVGPSGEILALLASGTFLGDRGAIHNDRGKILAMPNDPLKFRGSERPIEPPAKLALLFIAR